MLRAPGNRFPPTPPPGSLHPFPPCPTRASLYLNRGNHVCLHLLWQLWNFLPAGWWNRLFFLGTRVVCLDFPVEAAQGVGCGLLWHLGCRAGERLSPNHNCWGDPGRPCVDHWPTLSCSVVSLMLRRPPLLVYLSKQGQWHHLVWTQSTFCLTLGSGFAFAVLLLHPHPHRVAHMPSEMLTEAAWCVNGCHSDPGDFTHKA